jgi:hypothetical protein
MSVSLDAIRKAFKDSLGGISGLTSYQNMPSTPKMPCVVPVPASWTYDATEDGKVTWEIRLWFQFPADDLNKTQLAFDSYISPDGPNSVPAHLSIDPTLGGVVDSVRVIGGDQYLARDERSGTPILGSYLRVEVFA